jgi:hypothetical protein
MKHTARQQIAVRLSLRQKHTIQSTESLVRIFHCFSVVIAPYLSTAVPTAPAMVYIGHETEMFVSEEHIARTDTARTCGEWQGYADEGNDNNEV